MTKPIVHIKDAMFFNNRLMGVVIDYPEEHQGYPGAVTNGKDVITSSIVSIEGDTVETQRTIYHVDSWVKGMGV